MSAIDLLPVLEASNTLLEKLQSTDDKEEETKYIEEHLKFIESQSPVLIPEFRADYKWINVSNPLSRSDLKGKIVVLDFFTYCCLNCLNLLPKLQAIEEKFRIPDGLVVIGVHSAKFRNERVLDNVKNAVRRHKIQHPVINDSQGCLWNELEIPCWPTLIILGPDNQVLFEILGEGCKEILESIIATTLNYFKSKNAISDHEPYLPCNNDDYSQLSEKLSFPGKVSVNEDGRQLAISDTGNNRILITDFHGHVLHVIGDLDPGYINGSFYDTRFRNPQGTCWLSNDVLYIADTGNHAIRQVDLKRLFVSTVAGTGCQGDDKIGGVEGPEQPLNSPWDVCVGPSTDGKDDAVLFIAMAGLHQIWALFLNHGTWLKQGDVAEKSCFAIAGTGNEENRNNMYPHRASFAQPSGVCLAVVNGHQSLIIADSESSTIRIMSLHDGSVKNLAGGDKDPLNLFAFGDVDGVGTTAKLQHPLDVTWQPEHNRVFICDTYNHKLKILDLNSRNCYQFMGEKVKSIEFSTNVKFDELGGVDICNAQEELYVADTNNHVIRVIDLKNHSVKQLQLLWDADTPLSNISEIDGTPNNVSSRPHILKKLSRVTISPNQLLRLKLNLQLRPGYHLTENAPHSWKLHFNDAASALEANANQHCGRIHTLLEQPVIEITVSKRSIKNNLQDIIIIESAVYICSDSGRCYMKNIFFQLPVDVVHNGQGDCEVELVCILPCEEMSE